jgi:hypothetical protein
VSVFNNKFKQFIVIFLSNAWNDSVLYVKQGNADTNGENNDRAQSGTHANRSNISFPFIRNNQNTNLK